MNLPNKLTIFRMILILPFVVLLLGGRKIGLFSGIAEYTDYIALAILPSSKSVRLATIKIASAI